MDRQTEPVRIEAAAAADLIESHLQCAESSWSIGVSGAIAEFMYDRQEAVAILRQGNQLHATSRQGAVLLSVTDNLFCHAEYSRATCSQTATRKLDFFQPAGAANLPLHDVITELGPDHGPSSDGILFDLGLGIDSIQFCIRTLDQELLTVLRRHAGRPLFGAGKEIHAAIQAVSPPRVVCSRLGRIEVYGPIPADGGASPMAPHTHLLPGLLGRDRVPAARFRNVLTLYPAHPDHDKYGRPRAFDPAAEAAFVDLLARFGD